MEYLRIFWAFAYLLLFYACVFIVIINFNTFTLAEKLTFGLVISGFQLLSTLITSSKES
jgi:hypothetical protein